MSFKQISFNNDVWIDLGIASGYTGDMVIQNKGYVPLLVNYDSSPVNGVGFSLKEGEALKINDQPTVKIFSPTFGGILYVEEV